MGGADLILLAVVHGAWDFDRLFLDDGPRDPAGEDLAVDNTTAVSWG